MIPKKTMQLFHRNLSLYVVKAASPPEPITQKSEMHYVHPTYCDPADYTPLHRTDEDYNLLFLSEKAPFMPEKHFKFPTRNGRRYNIAWEQKRPWLRYSFKNDSAYCCTCLCFGSEIAGTCNPFLRQGFTNWKKAVRIKDSYLDQHANSNDHITSCQKAVNFIHTMQTAGSDIHSKISKTAAEAQIRTKKGILSIIDIVIALGQRGIPFRGNWQKEEQTEDGNFAFFTTWKAKFDNDLDEHLKTSSRIRKYTSPQIQNEILSLCEKDIREKIVIGIQQYWSLLADETQDCSTSEQISVCVRYVNNNVVHEDFMGFVETDKMDAQTITDKLVACLTSWNLDMNNLVGQGYDGAAVMSSGKNGVQAKIRALYENAVYVHCRSHVLALAISASCKQIPAIRNLFDSVERITWFLGGSAKRKNVFVNVAAGNQNNDLQELLLIDEDDMEASNSTIQQGSNRRTIPKFCSTRWTARIDTLAALIAQYQCVLESLEGIAEQSSGDARNDARSYCRLLTDSQFIVSLVVAQFVLSYCARVTKSLQAVSCDLGKAYRDVILSKDAIAKARSEVTWNKLWGRIECIANATGIGIVKPRTAGIQQHRANATLNANQPPREYYRINVFYPFIDHVVQELETRFSSEHSTLLAAEVLVPYYHDQLNAVKISYIKEYYGKFLQRGENFDAEKDKWVIMYRDIPRDQRPKTASDSLAACSQEYFPAVHIILTIFLTTPVGSVACERSFSALRHLKLWTRSSMAQDRLSGLGMLLVHRDNVDLVPKPDEIFSRKSNWRQ